MDKIGNIGNIKTGDFYTRDNWGAVDHPNIWSKDFSKLDTLVKIDFVFKEKNEVWGSDDDTDIEYMYQHLIYNNSSILTSEQIRDGWLNHIMEEEENYLWVSNQKAFDLMKQGDLPPKTRSLDINEHYKIINTQITTEIYRLLEH